MDIGTLTGTIAIEDQLSGALEMSTRKINSYVTDFTKSFGPMGVAALGTATAVVGGVTAMTAAIVALGIKGSDVNDLKDSMDKFAGGTANATKIMDEMQKGTLGTVDKMSLMTTASKLLSTGTLKTSEDFGTLSATASILANRGFGSTEEMMQKLSSAMTTGRTKGLSLAGVNVDLEVAQRNYAESIGVSSKELTDAEKLMVNQQAIMAAYKDTVKEAGEQHRDFADNITAAGVFVKDFITDLSGQVAASPAVTEAMDKIGEALSRVFGGGTSKAIDLIMMAIDGFAKGVSETVDFVMEFASIFQDSFGNVEVAGSAVASMFESVWDVVKSLMPVVITLAKGLWAINEPLYTGLMKVLPLVAILFKGLALVIDEVAKAVTWLLEKITAMIKWVQDAIMKVPFVAKAFEGLSGMVNLATDSLSDQKKVVTATATATDTLTDNTKDLTKNTRTAGDAARKHAADEELRKKRAKESAAASEELAKALFKLSDVQSGLTSVNFGLDDDEAKKILERLEKERKELEKIHETLKGIEQQGIPAVFTQSGIGGVGEKVDVTTTKVRTLNDTVNDLAGAFINVGQASGGTLGKMMGAIGSTVVMANEAQKAVKASGGTGQWGYGSVMFDSKATGADRIGAASSAAMSIAGGIGDMKNALDSRKTSDRLIGSTMAGAKMGSAFGPYGMAIGAAAGLVIGLIKGKPEWAKAADEIGRDLGVTVSDELGKQIGKDIKELGGRAQGIAVNLAGIIAEGGGLNDKNIDKFTAKFAGAMALVKSGQLDMASGTKIVEENWDQFAQAGTSAFGVLNKDLVKVIKSTKELGIESEKVTQYLGQEGQAVANHFGNALTTIGATTIKTQEAADAIAIGLAGSFDAMIEAGMSFNEALVEIAPAISALEIQMQAAGLTGSDAFMVLQEQVALYSDAIAGPALSAVDELSLGMVSLSNMGILNQDTFVGLSGQITATFSELVAQGNDSNVVMIGMRDSIQRMWEEQQEFGYTTDESTQALIDQAVQQGIVGEKHKSVTDQMLTATNRMVTVLEAVATTLGATIPTAAQTGARGVQSALDGITAPHLTVGVSYSDPGFTPGHGGGENPDYAMAGGRVSSTGVQYLATGGEVMPFMPRGTDTVPAMLTPGERVLNVQQNETYENYMEGPSNEEVVLAVNGLRTDLNSKLPRALARSLHAGLVGLRTAS